MPRGRGHSGGRGLMVGCAAGITGELLIQKGFANGCGHGRAAGALRISGRASLRSRPSRRLPARVRPAQARLRGSRMLEPAQASVEDLLLFHTPEYVEFVQHSSEQGGGYLDGGDTPSFRGVYEARGLCGRREPAGRRMDHGGPAAARLCADRRTPSRRARSRRRLLRVQRLRRRHRSAAPPSRPQVHRPTSTSTRTTATACTTPSRMIRVSSLPTARERRNALSRHRQRRPKLAAARPSAPSSTCRCRPAPGTLQFRTGLAVDAGACGALRARIPDPAVRRRQRRRRPADQPALYARRPRSRRPRPVRAGRSVGPRSGCWRSAAAATIAAISRRRGRVCWRRSWNSERSVFGYNFAPFPRLGLYAHVFRQHEHRRLRSAAARRHRG